MSQTVRVGVAVLITRGNEVLLLRRANVHGAGSWAPPGGHLEYGEAPEECAMREAKEETGLDVAAVEFRALTNDIFPEGKHYITLFMQAVEWAGEPSVAAPSEASEIGWFDWHALPQPLFLPFQNLLKGQCYPSTGMQDERPNAPGETRL